MEKVDTQVARVSSRIEGAMLEGEVKGVNRGGAYLLGLAISKANEKEKGWIGGRRLAKSLVLKPAEPSGRTAKAWVLVDTDKVKWAGYVHERRQAITIRPKVKKYLWIPISAEGRQHELHANDAWDKGLKGWIKDKSIPFGDWSDPTRKLDFILKKEQRLPASPKAGYLTDTAKRHRAEIIQLMRTTVWDVVKRLMN